MKTKFAAIAALGALSLAAIAPQAAAADNGFYLGAGITKSEFDVGSASDSLDDNSYKIIAGFRPFRLACRRGQFHRSRRRIRRRRHLLDAQAFTVSAPAHRGIRGDRPVRARSAWPTGSSTSSLSGFGSVSDDGWEPTYGVGIGAHFGSIGVRAEYETLPGQRLRLRCQHGFAELHLHVSVAPARQVAW